MANVWRAFDYCTLCLLCGSGTWYWWLKVFGNGSLAVAAGITTAVCAPAMWKHRA